jgi:hypothetical protein
MTADSPLLITAIRFGRELDDGVQGNHDVWEVRLGQVMEVCVTESGAQLPFNLFEWTSLYVQAAQDCLTRGM